MLSSKDTIIQHLCGNIQLVVSKFGLVECIIYARGALKHKRDYQFRTPFDSFDANN